jgi:hypothetical protein
MKNLTILTLLIILSLKVQAQNGSAWTAECICETTSEFDAVLNVTVLENFQGIKLTNVIDNSMLKYNVSFSDVSQVGSQIRIEHSGGVQWLDTSQSTGDYITNFTSFEDLTACLKAGGLSSGNGISEIDIDGVGTGTFTTENDEVVTFCETCSDNNFSINTSTHFAPSTVKGPDTTFTYTCITLNGIESCDTTYTTKQSMFFADIVDGAIVITDNCIITNDSGQSFITIDSAVVQIPDICVECAEKSPAKPTLDLPDASVPSAYISTTGPTPDGQFDITVDGVLKPDGSPVPCATPFIITWTLDDGTIVSWTGLSGTPISTYTTDNLLIDPSNSAYFPKQNDILVPCDGSTESITMEKDNWAADSGFNGLDAYPTDNSTDIIVTIQVGGSILCPILSEVDSAFIKRVYHEGFDNNARADQLISDDNVTLVFNPDFPDDPATVVPPVSGIIEIADCTDRPANCSVSGGGLIIASNNAQHHQYVTGIIVNGTMYDTSSNPIDLPSLITDSSPGNNALQQTDLMDEVININTQISYAPNLIGYAVFGNNAPHTDCIERGDNYGVFQSCIGYSNITEIQLNTNLNGEAPTTCPSRYKVKPMSELNY